MVGLKVTLVDIIDTVWPYFNLCYACVFSLCHFKIQIFFATPLPLPSSLGLEPVAKRL
jgi:hypothetical protein